MRSDLKYWGKSVDFVFVSAFVLVRPKQIGSTIPIWAPSRVNRNPMYCRHWDEKFLRHCFLSHRLLPRAVKLRPRLPPGTFCQKISTPRSDNSMIKNSTD